MRESDRLILSVGRLLSLEIELYGRWSGEMCCRVCVIARDQRFHGMADLWPVLLATVAPSIFLSQALIFSSKLSVASLAFAHVAQVVSCHTSRSCEITASHLKQPKHCLKLQCLSLIGWRLLRSPNYWIRQRLHRLRRAATFDHGRILTPSTVLALRISRWHVGFTGSTTANAHWRFVWHDR